LGLRPTQAINQRDHISINKLGVIAHAYNPNYTRSQLVGTLQFEASPGKYENLSGK
jgi:hypothetical protein